MTLGGRGFGKRFDVAGYARFLTFSCVDRTSLFSDEWSRDTFSIHLAKTAHRHEVSIFAWVLMSEHAHLLIGARSGGDTGAFIEQLKSSAARSLMKRWREGHDERVARCTYRNRTALWQPGGGYDRALRDEPEVDEKLEYIHANPVRRGLVARAADWSWSSARWCAGDHSVIVPITPVPR